MDSQPLNTDGRKAPDEQAKASGSGFQDGERAPWHNMEHLFQKLSEAFPDARIRAVQPMAARAYLVVQDGLFSAVLIRPTEQGLQIKSGLPPSGFGVALGPIGLAFQRRQRAALYQQVRRWVQEEMGWRVLP